MRNIMAVAAMAVSLTIDVAYPGIAWSAPDTSVQDVIDALKPHPGKSRGSRPVVAPPAGDVAGAAPAAVVAPVSTARPAIARAAPSRGGAVQDDRPSLDFNITFATGSAELTPAATKVLDVLGKALASADLASSHFRIEGHTDTVGSPDANHELSDRRAHAVVDYLTRTYGIAAGRLDAVGMGQEALLIKTGPQVSEQRNRRVHVVNLSS